MPAYLQPTGGVNAALGIAPVDVDTRALGTAMERLQKAYEAGVVNFNDLMDAATTKPAARKALMAQLGTSERKSALENLEIEAKTKDLAASERMRPDVERAATLAAEIKRKQAEMDALITGAQQTSLTPEQATKIGQSRVDVAVAQPYVAMQTLINQSDELGRLAADPYGQIDNTIKKLNALGYIVPDGASREDIQRALTKAITDTETRRVQNEILMKSVEAIGKSNAARPEKEQAFYKEFRADPTVANAQTVRAQAGIIGKSLNQPKPTAASDMAAIFSFMKVLDPGSVVREGEYERARLASGVVQRYGLEAMLGRVSKGLLLTPEQRKEFLDTSKKAFEAHIDAANRVRSDFRAKAVAYGLNPDNVTFDLTPDFGSGGSAATAPEVQLGPDEVLARPKDPETGKPGPFKVYRKLPNGNYVLKEAPTPGLTGPDKSIGPGDVVQDRGDIKVRRTVLPAEYQ